MNKLEAIEYYIKHTALPNKLGRVIYYNNTGKIFINAIRDAGLTPISLRAYRQLQAKEAGRDYKIGGYT